MHVPPVMVRPSAAPLGYGSSVVNHGFPFLSVLSLCVNGIFAEPYKSYVCKDTCDVVEWWPVYRLIEPTA